MPSRLTREPSRLDPPLHPEPEQVEVEDATGEDDMIDNMFRRMPRKVGIEATRLYEMLLIRGCDPGDAKLKVVELYSPLSSY